MRLDKFLSNMGIASRSEATKAARGGLVTVNGLPCRDAAKHIDPEKDKICFNGKQITYEKFRYILLTGRGLRPERLRRRAPLVYEQRRDARSDFCYV